MRQAIVVYVGSILLVLGLFQNCSKTQFSSSSSSAPAADAGAAGQLDPNAPNGGPNSTPTDSGANTPGSGPITGTIVAIADPTPVPKASGTTVSVTTTNLTGVTYSCTAQGGSLAIASGSLPNANGSFPIASVGQDISCVLNGVGQNLAAPISTTLTIPVDCGAQVKDANGVCQDFKCQSVVQLTSANISSVPARTIAGVCYAYKLMSAIPNGASTLTTAHDGDILARVHGGASNGQTANPFQMGSVQTQFTLAGPRTVKLSGGVDATSPILVDNFITAGVFPAGSTPNVGTAYRVYGTSDSSVIQNGAATNYVLFQNVPLMVTAFASGGTASVAPVDITAFAAPNVAQTLDVRALDCGGSRQMSDIYVLFQ